MDQESALRAVESSFKAADPKAFAQINIDIDQSLRLFDYSKVIKVGSKLPSFRLSDATGSFVSSNDLLQKGALLLTFYRGEWCPFCNVAVQYLQRHLEDFQTRGVSLVAITPESPDYSLSAVEKHGLKFPVLTDSHNELSKQLGIVYNQSWAREFHAQRGIDLNARNGGNTWKVPVPATILVDHSGTVRNMHIDADFRERLDPKVALKWIDQMDRQ